MLYTAVWEKKIFCSRSPTSPYLRPKCVHEIFFQDEFTPWKTHFWVFLTSKMDSQT